MSEGILQGEERRGQINKRDEEGPTKRLEILNIEPSVDMNPGFTYSFSKSFYL